MAALKRLGETEREVAGKVAWLRAHCEPLVPARALEQELAEFESEGLIGTPEQITERLAPTRDFGLGYAICYFADAAYDRSSIDLFAEKVIPELAS